MTQDTSRPQSPPPGFKHQPDLPWRSAGGWGCHGPALGRKGDRLASQPGSDGGLPEHFVPPSPVPSVPRLPGTEPRPQWPSVASPQLCVPHFHGNHAEGCPPRLGLTGSPGASGASCARAGKQVPESWRCLGHRRTTAPLPPTGRGPALRGRRTWVVGRSLPCRSLPTLGWCRGFAGRVLCNAEGTPAEPSPPTRWGQHRGCWGRESSSCKDASQERGSSGSHWCFGKSLTRSFLQHLEQEKASLGNGGKYPLIHPWGPSKWVWRQHLR